MWGRSGIVEELIAKFPRGWGFVSNKEIDQGKMWMFRLHLCPLEMTRNLNVYTDATGLSNPWVY